MKLENITWAWREHPIGFPTDPEDEDFKSPRTPPMVSLALEYTEGDIHLRQGIRREGTRADLSALDIGTMATELLSWLAFRL